MAGDVAKVTVVGEYRSDFNKMVAALRKDVEALEKNSKIELGNDVDFKNYKQTLKQITDLNDEEQTKLAQVNLSKPWQRYLDATTNEKDLKKLSSAATTLKNELGSVVDIYDKDFNMMKLMDLDDFDNMVRKQDALNKAIQDRANISKAADTIQADSLDSLLDKYSKTDKYLQDTSDDAIAKLADKMTLLGDKDEEAAIKRFAELSSVYDQLKQQQNGLQEIQTPNDVFDAVRLEKNIAQVGDALQKQRDVLKKDFGAMNLDTLLPTFDDTDKVIQQYVDEGMNKANRYLRDAQNDMSKYMKQIVPKYSQDATAFDVYDKDIKTPDIDTEVDVSSEISDMKNLGSEVDDVTSAVEKKNAAFKDGSGIVDDIVNSESKDLNDLGKQVDDIVNKKQELDNNIKNINDGQGVSIIDEDQTKVIDDVNDGISDTATVIDMLNKKASETTGSLYNNTTQTTMLDKDGNLVVKTTSERNGRQVTQRYANDELSTTYTNRQNLAKIADDIENGSYDTKYAQMLDTLNKYRGQENELLSKARDLASQHHQGSQELKKSMESTTDLFSDQFNPGDLDNNLKQISKSFDNTIKQVKYGATQTTDALEAASSRAAALQQKDIDEQIKQYQQNASKILEDYNQYTYGAQLSKMQSQADKYVGQNSDSLNKARQIIQEYSSSLDTLRRHQDANDDLILSDEEISKIGDRLKSLTKEFKNNMVEVGNTLSQTLAPGVAEASANKVEAYFEKNTRAAKKYGAELQSLAQQYRQATTQKEKTQLDTASRSLQSRISAEGLTGKSTWESLKGVFGRVFSYSGAYDLLQNTVMDLPRQMWSDVLEYDDAMTNLRMATSASQEQAQQLMETYSDMGNQLKATATDVATSSVEWQKQGKTIEESNALAQDSIILSKIGDLSSEDSTATITAAMKSYDLAESDVMDFIDQISSIDMASATDVGGLAEAFNKVAANAKQAGVSTEEVLSYAAVIGETTQQDMASVGNTLNSVFSRMGNIKLSRLKDYETGEDLSNVETVLRGVGIQLRDSQDEFRDFDEVLEDTASRWDTFSGVQQRAVAQAFAG